MVRGPYIRLGEIYAKTVKYSKLDVRRRLKTE